MRALIHFPIIHSAVDLGSLGDATQTEQQAAIEHFWTLLKVTIESLDLDYANLKLYQDGLPVCGKETEIVAEVATAGSQNYQLLQDLQYKGATLMGTESPELLLAEHALMARIQQSKQGDTDTENTARSLLKQRDAYIAQRINSTLHDDEIAILFLGLLHNIDDILPDDIVLIQPLGKPLNPTV